MLLYSTGPVPLHYKQEEYRSPSTVTTLPVLQVEAVQQILVLLLYILYLYTCTTSRRRTAVLVLYSTCTLALQVGGVQQSQYCYYTLPVLQVEAVQQILLLLLYILYLYTCTTSRRRTAVLVLYSTCTLALQVEGVQQILVLLLYFTCTLVLQIEGVQQILVLLLWIFLFLFQQFLQFLIREET